MKKMVIFSMVLFAAAPAPATVTISATQVPDTNNVVIHLTSDEVNDVRGITLDIIIEGGDEPYVNFRVAEVNCLSSDYYIYPGSVIIDDEGNVLDWGSCLCDANIYPGTLPGLDTAGVTTEMISLYVGEANKPPKDADLFRITLAGCGDVNVTLRENAIRGGVGMENHEESLEGRLVLNGCIASLPACGPACTRCPHFYDGDMAGAPWINEGAPDNTVDPYDLNMIVVNWGRTTGGEAPLDPCADCGCAPWINGGDAPDGVCDSYDLSKVVVNWGAEWEQ